MPALDPTQTVANIVLDHSECASVFQHRGIDYCCRGAMPLTDACSEKGLDTEAVLGELARAIDERRGGSDFDPRKMTTPELLDHIVSRHHTYLRRALPFVLPLAEKVARVHGDHNPPLVHLAGIVQKLVEALEPHLEAEEKVLFPALRRDPLDRVAVARELSSMQEEHLAVGHLLAEMRSASDEFRVPDWGCNSYRTLFLELEKLEGDILRHVHLENHVLMPRFV